MAKKTTEQPDDKRRSTVSQAIRPNDFDKLVARVASVNRSMGTDRQKKSELVRDAVDNQHLHKTAFAWFMKLRDMDPVKRNELLFHFEIYCERGNFTREELFTRDDDEEEQVVGTPPGEPDMRPSHLKQPGASAAKTVDDIKADALSKVGRGKPKDDEATGSKPH